MAVLGELVRNGMLFETCKIVVQVSCMHGPFQHGITTLVYFDYLIVKLQLSPCYLPLVPKNHVNRRSIFFAPFLHLVAKPRCIEMAKSSEYQAIGNAPSTPTKASRLRFSFR